MRPQDNQNDFFEVYDYKNDSILRSFYASNFPKELLEHHGRDQAFQKDIAISNDCKKMVIAYRFLNMISIVNIEKEEINNLFTDGNKLNWEQVIEGTPKPYYTKVHCNNAYIWAMAIEGKTLQHSALAWISLTGKAIIYVKPIWTNGFPLSA